MHSLLFYEPGHFHAALVLQSANPRLERSIPVYATPGPDTDRFATLVSGFNQRAVYPTAWELDLRLGPEPLKRLIAERRGDLVVMAGRNQPKLAAMRRLHEAGFPVLADKPWITTGAAIDDLHRVTAGPPPAVDLMTGRHDVENRLRQLVVSTEPVFGRFAPSPDGAALDFRSVHHLCKTVDGRPLQRPGWYYDVDVQGDGLVDIHSHMVDQAQWMIESVEPGPAGPADEPLLERATRWSTPVPRSLYTESTGEAGFPLALADRVHDGVLDLACNGQIEYRLRGVKVRQRAEWRARAPDGGGDAHRLVARGTGAHVTVDRSPTDERATIEIGFSDLADLARRLDEHVDAWRSQFPGLDLRPSEHGFELVIPPALDTPHESTFAVAIDRFLDLIESGRWPAASAADIRSRYQLLARAHDLAGRRTTSVDRAVPMPEDRTADVPCREEPGGGNDVGDNH